MPNATLTDPRTVLEAGIAQAEFSREMLNAFLDSLSDEDFVATPIPNFHNAYYIAGHLAWSDRFIRDTISGESTVCEESTAVFGFNVDFDASKRPLSRTEIMEKLDDARAKLIVYLRSLTDEQLAAPLPEGLEELAPNAASIMKTFAWHEGMHTGQIVTIRRAMGYPPLFG